MSLWSNCAECTFLSSETWIKLYTSVRCVWVSPCARHDFWACSMSDTFTFQTKARPKNSGVNVISCLRFCFSERKWACCCSLCAPFLDSFCVFPSTFFSPHLFLLLLDTARPIPPFSPTLSSHNFPMHTTFPSSSSSSPFHFFYYPSLCHTPGFITPLGVQVHSIMKDCAGQGAGQDRHVLQAVCIQEVHMLMEPVYLCEKFILVRQHSWQAKLLPCWPEPHKRVNRQRDQIDLPGWKSLI